MSRPFLAVLALSIALPAAAQVSLKVEKPTGGVAEAFTLKLDEKSFFDPGPFTGDRCSWTLDLGDGRKLALAGHRGEPHGYEFELRYARPGSYRITATPDLQRCHYKDPATAQVSVGNDERGLEIELFVARPWVTLGADGRPRLRERQPVLRLVDTGTLQDALAALDPEGRSIAEALLRRLATQAGAESVDLRWQPDETVPGDARLLAVQRWQREYRQWDDWLDEEPVSLGTVTLAQVREAALQLQARRREAEAERLAALRGQVDALAAAQSHWAAVRLPLANGVWCGIEADGTAEWSPTYLRSARLVNWARLSSTPRLRWVRADAQGNPLIEQSCGITVGPAPVLAAWVARAGIERAGLEVLAPTPDAELVADRARHEGFADVAGWRWARELGPGTTAADVQRLRDAGMTDTPSVTQVQARMAAAGYGSDRSVRTVLAFLADERDGRAKGLGAVAFRKQADAAAAERARAEREAQLREYPWTAEFRCTFNGAELGVIQCLLGARSGEGWISLTNGRDQKIYQPGDVTLGMDRLRLRREFRLSALNASDYVLKVLVRDARTGQVVAERAAPPRSRLALAP